MSSRRIGISSSGVIENSGGLTPCAISNSGVIENSGGLTPCAIFLVGASCRSCMIMGFLDGALLHVWLEVCTDCHAPTT